MDSSTEEQTQLSQQTITEKSQTTPLSKIQKKEDYITLVSAEGFEFCIPKQAASYSKVIKDMISNDDGMQSIIQTCLQLDGPFGNVDKIPFEDISTPILEMVCQYLCERAEKGVNLSSFKPLSSLNPETEEGRQMAIELLLAANYLDC